MGLKTGTTAPRPCPGLNRIRLNPERQRLSRLLDLDSLYQWVKTLAFGVRISLITEFARLTST